MTTRDKTPVELQPAQYFYFGWIFLALLWAGASLPNPARSEQANQLLLLAFLLVAHLPSLLYSLSLYFTLREAPAARRRNCRMTWRPAAHHAIGYLLLLLVLTLSYQRSWDFERIGLALRPERLIWSLLAGVIGCAGYLWLAPSGIDPDRADEPDPFQANTLRMQLPRGRLAQVLRSCDLVILGPLAEEIVYRGFFVYLLGSLCGLPLLGICTGFLLFLVLHLYQGHKVFLRQFTWFVFTIGLLYSPWGLFAVIVMHSVHNGYSLYSAQRRGRELVAAYRRCVPPQVECSVVPALPHTPPLLNPAFVEKCLRWSPAIGLAFCITACVLAYFTGAGQEAWDWIQRNVFLSSG